MRLLLCITSTIAFALSMSQCLAQNVSPPPYPARILPQGAENILPFAVDSPDAVNSISFLDQGAISAADRATIAAAKPGIEREAALAGFDLRQGNWSYQQIACPVLPEHLLLLYSRNNGASDISRFSAIIPRGGKGAVQILPILRRGFLTYTPAPESHLTIAAFNRIREKNQGGKKPDWLHTGLCYAALAGAQGAPSQNQAASTLAAVSPLLLISRGSSTVKFVVLDQSHRPGQWNLTFDPKGKLVKVEVLAAPPQQRIVLPK